MLWLRWLPNSWLQPFIRMMVSPVCQTVWLTHFILQHLKASMKYQEQHLSH